MQLLLMNGITTPGMWGSVGAALHVIDAEPDFNGDGKSDLVIANDTTGDIQCCS